VPYAEDDHGIAIDAVPDNVGAAPEWSDDLAQVRERVVLTGPPKLRVPAKHVSGSPDASDRPLSGRGIFAAEEFAHPREPP